MNMMSPAILTTALLLLSHLVSSSLTPNPHLDSSRVIPNPILAMEGQATMLTCTESDHRWSTCTWTFQNQTCTIRSDSSSNSCLLNRQELTPPDSRCSVILQSVGSKDVGLWTCSVELANASVTMNNQTRSGAFNLNLYAKPEVSFRSKPDSLVVLGQEYTMECLGQGKPLPEVRGFMSFGANFSNELELDSRVLNVTNGSSENFVVDKAYKFRPEKEHKFVYLKCFGEQKFDNKTGGVPKQEDLVPTSSMVERLEVVFPPLPSPESPQTFPVRVGEPALIRVVFFSNPPPRDDQVTWHFFQHESSNKSKPVQAGQILGLVQAHKVMLVDTQVVAYLAIANVSLVHTERNHYLDAVNEYGRFRFTFRLVSDLGKLVPIVIEEQVNHYFIYTVKFLFMLAMMFVIWDECCRTKKGSVEERRGDINVEDGDDATDEASLVVKEDQEEGQQSQFQDEPFKASGQRMAVVNGQLMHFSNKDSSENGLSLDGLCKNCQQLKSL